MSRVRFTKISTPSSPPTSTAEIFYSTTDSRLEAIDQSGNIMKIGGFATLDYRLIKVTTITQGTTSYTPTAGMVRALWVEAWGAGGGGAGVAQATASQITNAVGGGGGAYSAAWLTGSAVTSAYTCVVGLGGPGGTAGANDGTSGTDTTLTDGNSVLRLAAKGGVKGTTANGLATGTSAAITGVGGAGGAAGSGTGDMLFSGGQPIVPGQRLSGTVGFSGPGGAAASGGSGGAAVLVSSTGNAGAFPGGGGSGAMDTGTAARAGGAGANGLLRIWEFA